MNYDALDEFKKATEQPWPCVVNTNGWSSEAMCHGLGINKTNGRPYALVQYIMSRSVGVVYLDEHYSIAKLEITV